jgi:2'-5' RNA ligase
LFVALELPAEVKDDLARMCHGLPGAKWRSLEQFHLTLRFIGEVDGALARDIELALASVTMPGFELSLAHVGHFGDRRRPRVAWIGVADSEDVNRLNRRTEKALCDIGLPTERRKFKPHVTLARLKETPIADVASYEATWAGFASAPFRVQSFQLYSSFLSASGAIYTVEADYALETAPEAATEFDFNC